MLSKITRRAPQVRGELKTKVRPLVEVMYGFEGGYKNGTARKNAELVDELKEEYAFVYKVSFLCHVFLQNSKFALGACNGGHPLQRPLSASNSSESNQCDVVR